MQSFSQTLMRLDQLTQAGWGDAADYFCEEDKIYGTAELMVPAVVKPQTDKVAAAPAPPTFGDDMENLDIITRKSEIPQGTSQPGGSYIFSRSRDPQSHKHRPSLPADNAPNSSPINQANPVWPTNF